MAIEHILDPELTGDLRHRIVDLWVAATNAGGAVGFVAPTDADAVRPVAGQAFDGVTAGIDRLLIQVDGDELTGLLFISSNRFALKNHWRVLKRVMVTPGRQGGGLGSALMGAAERAGRDMGLEALQVTVRGGQGIEKFYARLGYIEVGRIPGALRVAPGDDRDEVYMWLALENESHGRTQA